MRKRILVSLTVTLTAALLGPMATAAVKPGTKCSKQGQTITYAAIKYTCVKSGKNLVWSKGVAVKKSVPVPTPTPETKVEEKKLLASDSRITPISQLTALDTCKTEDKTPDSMQNSILNHKNGFPRPSQAITGKKQAKILVIPMSFKDLPFYTEKVQRGRLNSSDIEILTEVIPLVENSFKKLSLGRFEVKIDVLPQSEWWIFRDNAPFKEEWGFNNWPEVFTLIDRDKSNFKFDGYDSYVFIAGHGPRGLEGNGAAQGGFGSEVKNSKSGFINAVLMVGRFSQPGIWVHELGHSLFGFEDLYLFSDPGNQRSKEIDVPLNWDLMANATRMELLQWNRLLMGWLDDTEVRCLSDQQSTVHYISDFTTNSDPKLLTINIAPGVTLAAETRSNKYLAGSLQPGLLLYTINTYINHGEGPILTQNSLLSKGQIKAMLGWEFTVLDFDADGLLISVTKTDIDKFVPPPPKPTQNNPSQPNSKIKVSKGEVVPNGFLKGRATWDVTGHQSYRLYVTDVVDFQKVYFESGYINDSRNPVVVEISGLVCNKEFRTMTEFFTEKDGKGERLVMQSLQLRNLSCEDTTKKP
jgi:M6 family metalloprotease-like protein